MKYIYGPVKSRRLGMSLGVTTVEYKTCNFDCVYCQLGSVNKKAVDRREYVAIDKIISELKNFLKGNDIKLDYITLSGFGEPLLHSDLSGLINKVKKITPTPIAILTNSALLIKKEVRKQLLGADLICPSLDAVDQDVFEKINRPFRGILIKEIIEGLRSFREEFSGKIFLEIMLVGGINDDLSMIERILKVSDTIKPDKVHLVIPARAAAEKDVTGPSQNRLEQIKKMFGRRCEIVK